MSSFEWPAIKDIAAAVQAGTRHAQDLVNESLKLIAANSEYQAIISDCSERALQRAKEIDKRVAAGEQIGPLAGVPFVAKDNFLTFGGETTAASNILRGFQAPYQATAIERLEASGAICVAKANLDAFGHGSSTENSDWFTTKNPHDTSRVAGGSSGGSAAAVALAVAPFALGTDTGGSIRLPASFCGTVGYKPTYGLVSRSGVIAMASSSDVIGPITRTVADAALVTDCMAGIDTFDSTTLERDKESYTDLENISLAGKKVGIIKEYFPDSLSPAVREVANKTISWLEKQGAQVEEVSIPEVELALACYYIICPAEISSNLARYDGQRYGYSAPDAKTLEESYSMSRSTGFGVEAKRRIMIGTYVLSSGYYDAYYKRAQQVRTKIITAFESAFESYDVLVGPTAATVAFKIGEKTDSPMDMYLNDVMTVAASLAGIPAISVPAGFIDGLPIGMQLFAKQRDDRRLLGWARQLEEMSV